MTRQRMLTVILIAGLTTALAVAAVGQPEKVLLRYKWIPGDQHRYALSGRGEGTMVMSGMPGQAQAGEVELPMVFGLEMTYGELAKAVDDDGNGTVELQLGPLHMNTDIGGQQVQVTLDYAKGTMTVNGNEQPLPGVSPEEGAQPMTMKMSPRGKVSKITGFERMMPIKGFGQMMDLDRWLRYAQAQFPEEPVVVGQTWEQLTPLPFAPGADQQPAQTQTTYTLQGLGVAKGRPFAQIGMASVMKLEDTAMPTPAEAQPEGLNMSMTFDHLNIAMKGSFDFDYQAGHVINTSLQMTMNLKMNITMRAEIEGEEQSFSIQQEMRDFAIELRIKLQE